MLEFLRKHSKWVLFFIILLIVPSFVFFGLSDYSGMNVNEKPLVQVNDDKITESQFNQSWTERLNSLRNQLSSNFKVSEVDTPEYRKLWLENLVDNLVITNTARDNKFYGSDSMVRYSIAQDPRFMTDGKFSMENYNAFLTSVSTNSQEYENYLRATLGVNVVVDPVINSTIVPDSTIEELKKYVTKTRQVQTKVFANEDFVKSVNIDIKELEEWFNKNAESKFRIPEYLNAEYIILNEKTAVEQVPEPNEDALRSYFENNKNRFSTEERRFVRHIQVETEEKANNLLEQLKADPSKFEELVLSESKDLGTKNNKGELGYLKKQDIPGLENTVFALENPGLTGPVKLGENFHIFDVVNIEKSQSKSFEELKPTLVNEVKLQIASEKFAELATNLTNLTHERRDDLKTIADDLMLPVGQVHGITKSGIINDIPDKVILNEDIKAIFNTPRVIDIAFNNEVYKQGQNSGVVEISPSEFLVFKLTDKKESAVPSFKSVKAKAAREFQLEKASELAQKAGEDFIKTHSASASVEPKSEDGSSRLREGVDVSLFAGNLPDALMADVMAIPSDKLPAYVGSKTNDGYVVARVVKDSVPDERMVRVFEQQFPLIVKNGTSAQIGDAYKFSLRDFHKVQYTDVVQKTIENKEN